MNKEEVVKLLIEEGFLKKEQVDIILKEKEKTGTPFGYLLIRFGLVNAERWYDFVLKK